MFYKRNKAVISLVCAVVTLLIAICSGCIKDDLPPLKQVGIYKSFSVNYLDVGQGDCIFIRLPDGKNLLMDTGVNDQYLENSKFVINLLNRYSVNKIDYLILTHPDLDHIGNAKEIISKFTIGRVYMPKISNLLMEGFDNYKQVLNLVNEKQIEMVVSDYNCTIVGENYALAFLSPIPIGLDGSSYGELEYSLYPTERQINDLSPIIYFECFNKRFVFTGDASSTQESIVLANYNSELYNTQFKTAGINVTLENVDYLKVSHHGADGATSKNFLSLLKPKNFIISVGKENFYGHPRSETLERILEICPESNLFRTDEMGTITVHKNKTNDVIVTTMK